MANHRVNKSETNNASTVRHGALCKLPKPPLERNALEGESLPAHSRV